MLETPPALPIATRPATASRLAAELCRCAAAGVRFVVTTPSDSRTFMRGLCRFPGRRVDPPEHTHLDVAWHVFNGGRERPHDAGSWRILALDAEDRVAGAITARFFCGEPVHEYLHAHALLQYASPLFREQAEQAVIEFFTETILAERVPAEISHWSVAAGWPEPALLGATLLRAMGALAAQFGPAVGLLAADCGRREETRLLRGGAAPLGRTGRLSLPPFVHHASGRRLRLLLLDSAGARGGLRAAPADVAALRRMCPVFSPL